jgi:hypothetical protein
LSANDFIFDYATLAAALATKVQQLLRSITVQRCFVKMSTVAQIVPCKPLHRTLSQIIAMAMTEFYTIVVRRNRTQMYIKATDWTSSSRLDKVLLDIRVTLT